MHEGLRENEQFAAAARSNPAQQQEMTSSGPENPSEVRLSLLDREPNFAIDETGLVCQAREEKDWQGCRASMGITKGRYYFEITVKDEGLCRVGWSTKSARFALGTDKEGFGFGGTGKKVFSSKFLDYGAAFGRGDTVGCLLDRTQHSVSFIKNGKNLGVAFEIPTELRQEAFYPAVTLKVRNCFFFLSFFFWTNTTTPPRTQRLNSISGQLRSSTQSPRIQRVWRTLPGKTLRSEKQVARIRSPRSNCLGKSPKARKPLFWPPERNWWTKSTKRSPNSRGTSTSH